jgi:regulator of protease activity HflC (stomatin/prohibitin superfamily)
MTDFEETIQFDSFADEEIDSTGSWLGRKWSFFIWSLVTILSVVIIWPYIVVNIGPGNVGVLYRRFFGGTELNYIFKEGTHSIFPWDEMYIYDVKSQEESYNLQALNKLGLNIELDVTVIFRLVNENTPLLQVTVGPNYKEKIIKPMLLATVVDVVSKHSTEEFFNDNLSSIKDEMFVNLISTIGRVPIEIDNVLIKKVRIPQALSQAINDKLVAHQKIYEKRFDVLQSVEGFKKAYVEANAVRLTQEIVNEKLTEPFLVWQGIEATKVLASNPNSKVVFVGNKDGLPVILNLDSNKGEASSPGVLTDGSESKENQKDKGQTTEIFSEWLEKFSLNNLDNFVRPIVEPLTTTDEKAIDLD